MAHKDKRRKKSFLRRNGISILFLGALLIYLSVTIVNQEIKLRDLQQEGKQLEGTASEIKQELADMEKKVEKGQDPELVEKIAREKLKMVKPNEIIYIIQD